MSAPLVALNGVGLARGGKPVLCGVSLAVDEGGVLALLGPNGAGKSTLLRLMALVDKPISGQIVFRGVDVKAAGRREILRMRRNLSLAMQEPLLVSGTVLENAALGLRLRGVSGPERERTARQWLERFGIAQLAERDAATLSGGEARRVSLARALAVSPDLLLLDEPFSALDEPSRHAIISELGDIIRAAGVTTVLVTHDRSEALALADTVAVMLAGTVRQTGRIQDVFASPCDAEVAEFLGFENMLSGAVIGAEDGLVRIAVGSEAVLEVVGDAEVGARARVMIRPEEITLAPVAEQPTHSSARNKLRGAVKAVTPLGPLVRVLVDGELLLSVFVTAQSAREMGLAPGLQVEASFKATAAKLFAPK